MPHPKQQNPSRGAVVTLVSGLGLNLGVTFVLGKLVEGLLHQKSSDLDDWVIHRTPKKRRSVTDQAMKLASSLGEPFVLYPLAGLASLRWLAGRQQAAALTTVAAVLGSAAIDGATKRAVTRPRPRFKIPLTKSSGSSFPSNHMIMSLATYGTIIYLANQARPQDADKGNRPRRRRLFWLPVLALCALIGWSRIYQGVHHPTDVLAGWIAGMIWLGTCIRLYHALATQTGDE